MKLWEHTGEELIGGAEITSDVILAPEIEMPWESDKVERIISMPNYATAPATGHRDLADQVLLERDGDGWRCVGHYVDDKIIVFRRVQNTGLRTYCSFAVWSIETSCLSLLLLTKMR
jgi:hypothetical protein